MTVLIERQHRIIKQTYLPQQSKDEPGMLCQPFARQGGVHRDNTYFNMKTIPNILGEVTKHIFV